MAYLLPAANALSSGSDLWVLVAPETNKWTTKIDWYLDFLISKSFEYQKFQIKPEMNLILQQVEWTEFLEPRELDSKLHPLLVDCAGRVPARWILCLPQNLSYEQCVCMIHDKWLGLMQPNFRVFAPAELSSSVFSALWAKQDPSTDYTLVLDL